MIKHLIFALLSGFMLFGAYVYFHLGAYKSPTIAEISGPEFRLLAKEHQGAYHKINTVITEVETWAKEKGYTCKLSFGRYLDNPETQEEGRLRSEGGCVMEASEQFPENLPEGFKALTLPAGQKYIQATWDGSPAIGPSKVYGPVQDLMYQKKLRPMDGVLEIYEILNEKEMVTTYFFPYSQ